MLAVFSEIQCIIAGLHEEKQEEKSSVSLDIAIENVIVVPNKVIRYPELKYSHEYNGRIKKNLSDRASLMTLKRNKTKPQTDKWRDAHWMTSSKEEC